MSLLNEAGHAAYLVGGCVRNTLLGAPISDIDIATSAAPDVVSTLATSAGIKVVPTGIEHGTVTLVVDDTAFEITTFRSDVSTDGRRATVRFSNSIEEDARRRDFTMNALYCDKAGEILDPVGGLPDLEKRRVVFIEDPTRRIQEDYLRILRFFRFHAWYGDDLNGLDAEGLAACAAQAEGVEQLSKERIGAEMIKLLSAPAPETALGAMDQAGVLTRILPGSGLKSLFALSALGGPVDPIVRLAAMGGVDVAQALRLSKHQAKTLEKLRAYMADTTPLHAVAYREGDALARAVAYLRAALFESPMDAGFEARIALGVDQTCPVVAADLMDALSGAPLGQALRDIEAHWIEQEFAPSKQELLSWYEGQRR